MKKNILIVDDEVQILKALKRVFMGTDYKIVTAESGEEALQILDESDFLMIISDMKMPGIDGFELLKRVKKKSPETLRLILSGYTDEYKVIKAMKYNIAKLYLFKPWENEKLLKTVDQLLETEENLQRNKNVIAGEIMENE